MAAYVSPFPSTALFAEILSEEPNWYALGTFLNVPTPDLDGIADEVRGTGPAVLPRRLIEVHKCLQTRALCFTWEHIATCLRKIGNNSLADKIHSLFIQPSLPRYRSPSSPARDTEVVLKVKDDRINVIAGEFKNLRERFDLLVMEVKRAFQNSTVDVKEVQGLIEDKCGRIAPHYESTDRKAQIDEMFKWLKEHCSFLQYPVLVYLVNNLLKEKKRLRKQISNFRKAVENFESCAKMSEFIDLIKEKQLIAGDEKLVQLKVVHHWSDLTMKQFEIVVEELLETKYADRVVLSQIRVGKGCMCVSWVIPDHIESRKLVRELPLELVKIIGIIYLHIGDDVIYSFEGEGRCETIEAAMVQAIELKNTRAIELLLAMGCSPEVATYNEGSAVTNIVNIREKSADSSSRVHVDHVCVFGHNEHVEAIVDPSSEYACSSCISKKEIVKTLSQDNESLYYSIKKRDEVLKDKNSAIMEKDAEIGLLQEKNKNLMKELEANSEFVAALKRARVLPLVTFIHSKDVVNPPVAISMSNFNEKKKSECEWFSPSFYSPEGYRLCLKVIANGEYEGKGSHVSAYVHIMSGQFDNKLNLSWPFMAEIELELLNRQKDENHKSFLATFNEASRDEATGQVVFACLTESGMTAWDGEGTSQLIHHNDLNFNSDTGTEYLKDDSLLFHCKKVTMMPQKPPFKPSTISTIGAALSFKPAAEFTLRHFSKLKSKNDKCEFAFDSHKNGYRLTLVIHPNGMYEHKGKSIALFVYLGKGDFDGKLVFPFRGIIYVQAVDRNGKSHVEFPVHFNEETDPKGRRGARVRTWDYFIAGRSTKGWGISNFLNHDLLPYNRHLGTQYLKEDEIIFRIARVVVLSC